MTRVLQTRSGPKVLQTRGGMRWLQTRGGMRWLLSVVISSGGEDILGPVLCVHRLGVGVVTGRAEYHCISATLHNSPVVD
jgi:hypothetical protein